MYFDLVKSFGKMLDRMGKGAREDVGRLLFTLSDDL
jgi:hypothetical protein